MNTSALETTLDRKIYDHLRAIHRERCEPESWCETSPFAEAESFFAQSCTEIDIEELLEFMDGLAQLFTDTVNQISDIRDKLLRILLYKIITVFLE